LHELLGILMAVGGKGCRYGILFKHQPAANIGRQS
jgi:hypothetical protein